MRITRLRWIDLAQDRSRSGSTGHDLSFSEDELCYALLRAFFDDFLNGSDRGAADRRRRTAQHLNDEIVGRSICP
jgi:hypothetical protein